MSAFKDAMAIPRPGAVKPAGWLGEWARGAAAGYTGNMTDVDEEFVRAWSPGFTPRGQKLNWWEGTWSCEGGAYWFDGLVRLAFQLDDPALKELAKRRLDPVLDRMGEHAIGFCWWLDRRERQHWDEVNAANTWMVNWVAGMFARPVSAWYEATGDKRAAIALRHALGGGYWVEAFKSTPTLPSGAYEAWRLTGDAALAESLRAYADKIAKDPSAAVFGSKPWDGLEETLNLKRRHHFAMKLPTRHGVYANEDLLSLFAAYRATGDEHFLELVRSWYAFFDKYARQPFGAMVMDEEWGHPGPGRGTETCALAAEIWTRLNLLAGLGEGSWGDDVERAFYNAAPATVDREWRNHVYFQLPNRFEASPVSRFSVGWEKGHPAAGYARKHSPLCCTAGLNRILPDFVQGMWMVTADGGVAAALYGPCSFSVELPSGKFAAEEVTDYPFADTIRIKVADAPAGEMPLSLRLPKWCASPEIAVNGVAVDAPSANGFLRLVRAWRKGDEIALRFPMAVRADVVRDLDDTRDDFAYLSAGPLLFARGYAEKSSNEPAEETAVPALDPGKVADGARLETSPLPHPWNWPLDAPVKLAVADASGAPLALVPYGCTKLRASLFPVRRGM